MALSTSTMRGLIRYLPGSTRGGVAVPRLIVHPDDTTPVYEPFYIRPTEVPSGTLAEGAIWFDDDNHVPAFYNGTVNREVASVPAGQGTVPNYRPVKRAATVLTSDDNGAICIWGAAAGYLFTLPVPAVGLWFDFVVEVTITSVGAKIITKNTGTEFLLGNFIQSTDSTYTSANFAANGTNIVSWNGNGSTTGGLAGDWVRVHAISATQWEVYGMGRATGTEASPFATS